MNYLQTLVVIDINSGTTHFFKFDPNTIDIEDFINENEDEFAHPMNLQYMAVVGTATIKIHE